MPLTHIEPYKVRHYECDGFGLLRNAVYLSYMEEAAFNASAAGGYDEAAYDAMRRVWLIHATELEIRRPLTYGESVDVKTFPQAMGRVLARRRYEFHSRGTGSPVAQGHSDWVFLDRDRSAPASIPPELVAAFFPEGAPASRAPREKAPRPPAAPPGAYRQERRVEWRDVDRMRHMNNAAYLAYAEACAEQLHSELGWPVTRWLDAGIALVARRHRLRYRQPALPGDLLEITTWLSDLAPEAATRHTAIARPGGTPLAHVETVWRTLDAASLRPAPLPEPFRTSLASNLAP